MADLKVHTILQNSDNYSYLIESGSVAAVIDVSDEAPVLELISKKNLSLRFIVSTHHHSDHTSGNGRLKKETGAMVLGGDSRIACIDSVLNDNDEIHLGTSVLRVFLVPGHTKKQLAYYEPHSGILFTGDTLFCCGCGRIFEGTAEQMYHSLMRLSDLPDQTLIFCGHEYTMDNIAFALTIEPENQDLQERYLSVKSLLRAKQPTVPSTMGLERKTNPFLRVHSKIIRKNLKMIDRSAVAVFAALRKMKDIF